MSSQIQLSSLPVHVAIIMDGNGRWAQQRYLPRMLGHKKGSEALEVIVEHLAGLGIKFLTVYAFSSENWRRPQEEVNALMELLCIKLRFNKKKLINNNIRFNAIGDISALPSAVQELIEELKRDTARYSGMTFTCALNYGSRDEITRAVNKLLQASPEVRGGGVNWQDINEQLDTADLPDPDLIIRTAGEQRLSNFLLLQAAYTEFYFTEIFWPDFTPQEFDRALVAYQSRTRRYGTIQEQVPISQ